MNRLDKGTEPLAEADLEGLASGDDEEDKRPATSPSSSVGERACSAGDDSTRTTLMGLLRDARTRLRSSSGSSELAIIARDACLEAADEATAAGAPWGAFLSGQR